MSTVPITKRGAELLKEELHRLKTKDRPAVINAIAELRRRPLDNLTEKQKRLKKQPGYELGPNVGLGANSVAAANRSRAKPKRVTIKRGTRRNKRGKSL